MILTLFANQEPFFWEECINISQILYFPEIYLAEISLRYKMGYTSEKITATDLCSINCCLSGFSF